MSQEKTKPQNEKVQEEKIKKAHHCDEECCDCQANNVDEPAMENNPEQKECAVSLAEYVRLKYQMAEVINKYNSLSHEFDNYRKRTKEEVKQAKIDGQTKAIEVILPALDAFKKAKDLITDKSSLSGVSMIEKSLMANLEKLGVKAINCKGKQFDPDFHNAVMLVEKEDVKSGTIVDEIEMGFTLSDKVVKYSQVIVSK